MFGKSGVHRCSNFLPHRKTGSQVQRFTILKEIVLQEGNHYGLMILQIHFLAIEKDDIALGLQKWKKILLVHRIWRKNSIRNIEQVAYVKCKFA